MSNLRTILEDLVKNIQDGDLIAHSREIHSKEMIEDAEREIKGLMLGKEDIDRAICEWLHLNRDFMLTSEVWVKSITLAIHSAMLKKLEETK